MNVFFNLQHLPSGLKIRVCLFLLGSPEVLDLLALQQHPWVHGYPKMCKVSSKAYYKQFNASNESFCCSGLSISSFMVTIPLAHLVRVHLDYLWVPAAHWAQFHLFLLENLSLPARTTKI